MKIAAAVAKIPKSAVRGSGDSAEVVERPLGGLSALIVDGQGSGQAAKTLSIALAGRAAGLITDGTRDGAVVRSVHDWLFAQKQGRVSATIAIISAATDTNTLVVSRSGHCPVYVFSPNMTSVFADPGHPLGFYRYSRPQVDQVPLEPGLVAVTFTDGVLQAGRRRGRELDMLGWQELIRSFYRRQYDPGQLAEIILGHALELDQNRPFDDMTVAVVALLDQPADGIRRLRVEYPR